MKTDNFENFERAWKYANGFMYENIHSEKHLDIFLGMLEVEGKKFSKEEIDFLRDAWFVITTGKCSHSDVVETTEDEVEEPEEDAADLSGLTYHGNEH